MKLIARLPFENTALVATLAQRGITAKIVRNATIIELQPSPVAIGSYDLPTEASKAKLVLELSEHGGGMTNTGSATIVCDFDGKALKPYRVNRHSNGDHAFFSLNDGAVTITASKGNTMVAITEHRPVNYAGIAWIESKELWKGEAPAIEWHCAACKTNLIDDSCPTEHWDYRDPTNEHKCSGSPRRSKLALPTSLDRFQAAALAARSKAGCYHCRCQHYIAQ